MAPIPVCSPRSVGAPPPSFWGELPLIYQTSPVKILAGNTSRISGLHLPFGAVFFTLFVLVLIAIAARPVLADANGDEAVQFIQNLADKAVKLLRDDGSSLQSRESEFQTLLYDGFALDRIGRFVVGRYWWKMNLEQQEDYQKLFKQWVLKTYSIRLGGYSGQTVTIVNVVEAGATDRYIRTLIDQSRDGESVRCDWRVRHIDGTYKIVDVVVEGISMVVTQRQEFTTVVRRHGVDGLIEVLRARVSKRDIQLHLNS